MMTNIKISLQYDGSDYYGWQVQGRDLPEKKTLNIHSRATIQGELERVLKKIFQKDIKVTGASRTDAGTHAIGQTANFFMDGKMPIKVLMYSMNSMLPKDISISHMVKADKTFDARYDAKSKLYEYSILNQKWHAVLNRHYYWHIRTGLDWDKIKKVCDYFPGKHNFSAFESSGSPRKRQDCNIIRFEIKKKRNLYKIRIESDYFLYKMVRNIVGMLVQVGKGNRAPEHIKEVLRTGKNKVEYETAPSKGLCLIKVKY